MSKSRYCEMCDQWFPRLRTAECPLCGDRTQLAQMEDGMNTNVTIRESRRVVRPLNIVLDHALRLPMAGRIRTRMRTICDVCREPITDEYFYGGFSAGHKNLLLHERCTPEAMRSEPLPASASPQGAPPQ